MAKVTISFRLEELERVGIMEQNFMGFMVGLTLRISQSSFRENATYPVLDSYGNSHGTATFELD